MTQGTRAAILGTALAAAFAAAAARAQPFTGYLDPVEAAASARLAVFPEPQTRAESAQLRALEKCLRSYERNSTSPDRDLATLGSMANSLDRAFPGDPEFGLALDGALDAFRQEIEADRDRIEAYLEPLDPESGDYRRTVDTIGKLEEALLLADGAASRKAATAALRKARKASIRAWNAILGFEGIYARQNEHRVGVGRMTALVETGPFEAHVILAKYYSGDQVLFLEGVDWETPIPGPARTMGFIVGGVTGPGTYPIDAAIGPGFGFYRELILTFPILISVGTFGTQSTGTPYTGTLTITTLDLERRLVEGTFGFTALDPDLPAEEGVRTITDGAFRSQLRLGR